jgi:hypothetical protein
MVKKTRSRYTTFYKVMLILSTIGTSFGVLGLLSVPDIINEFSISPLFGIGMIALSAIALVSIVALVLLWQKQVEGYILKIGSYVASIVAVFLCLLGAQPYVRWVIEQTEGFPGDLSASEAAAVSSVIEFIFYAGLVMNIIINITLLLLWRSAWKRQLASDKK